MSTLRNTLEYFGYIPKPEEQPKLAWVWTTETMKNCMMGKHERDLNFLLQIRRLSGESCITWVGHAADDVPMAVCKHCRCFFVEQS